MTFKRFCDTEGFDENRFMKPFTDEDLAMLWNELGMVPIDENECLEEDFYNQVKGIHREEVWEWFDIKHSKGVAWLMGVADD